jgi:hypothetical protein
MRVPNKSMTYIDLAKLFNVDAVTYNVFVREFYGWIPHNSSFGFLDLTPATLGQIHF